MPGEEPRQRQEPVVDHREPERIALALAISLGRVTNATLREATGLDAADARSVLSDLVTRGALEQRGVKRGTHYVLTGVSSEVEALADDAPGMAEQNVGPADSFRQPLLRSLRRAVSGRRARR